MNFPERLRQLRKSANISQQTLGNAMNVTKVSISGYETGNRKPDTDTLQKLADYFDVSTDYLLGRSEAKETRASYHSKVSDNSMTSEEAELLTQLQKTRPYITILLATQKRPFHSYIDSGVS